MDKVKSNENNYNIFCELLKDKFYFGVLTSKPTNVVSNCYFSIDEELVYRSFYMDFGPLNLAMLYRYCQKVNQKLKTCAIVGRKLVHYTNSKDLRTITNSAFLAGSYAVLYLKYSPEQVMSLLTKNNSYSFMPYRDVSYGPSSFDLSLLDCFRGLSKAKRTGIFDIENMDLKDYEHYEKLENGDLNWIIPKKFLAFSGPVSKASTEGGFQFLAPESYIPYFRRNYISTIIRLNKKLYDAARFTKAGFEHYDLFFVDGSTPSPNIVQAFLNITENARGAIAVHCKAGLGRTGTLIGCYLMKNYKFTALDAIAWMRIVRPGSVIGQQQHFLLDQQLQMWTTTPASMSRSFERPDNQESLPSDDRVRMVASGNRTEGSTHEVTTFQDMVGFTQGDILKRQKINHFSDLKNKQHLKPQTALNNNASIPRLFKWFPARSKKMLTPPGSSGSHDTLSVDSRVTNNAGTYL